MVRSLERTAGEERVVSIPIERPKIIDHVVVRVSKHPSEDAWEIRTLVLLRCCRNTVVEHVLLVNPTEDAIFRSVGLSGVVFKCPSCHQIDRVDGHKMWRMAMGSLATRDAVSEGSEW